MSVAQHGIGTGACGPVELPRYTLHAVPVRLVLDLLLQPTPAEGGAAVHPG